MESVFKVKNLKKHFPIVSGILRRQVGVVRAVDGVDWELKKGEVLGIVGESGSGKSTAARAAIRLIEPTAGTISFLERDVLKMGKRELIELRKKIQMVFQDPYASLNPRKTIGESIGEALTYHRIVNSKEEVIERVEKTLDAVGLDSDFIDHYPHELSGGQQQRVCIGRAIIIEPELIICDEAVSALDVSVQGQILNLLGELKEKFGLSYLFISHDLSVIRYLCDRVLVMENGKIIEEGKTDELFKESKHPYTQQLVASIPKISVL